MESLQKARQLWMRERYGEAIEYFRLSLSEHPRSPEVLIDSARAFGQWYEHSEMERLNKRLLRLMGNSAEAHFQVGLTYRMSHWPEEALKHYKRSLSKRKGHLLCLLEAAIVAERLDQQSLAEGFVDRCLQLSPQLPEALLVRARIHSAQKQYVEAVACIEKVVAMPERVVASDTRARALIEWATLSYKLGKEHEVLDRLKSAKLIQRQEAQTILSNLSDEGEVNRLFCDISSEDLSRWRSSSQRGEGVVLMASFPRSGTTLLESLLGRYRRVVASDELDVFSKKLLPRLIESLGGTEVSTDGLNEVPESLWQECADDYYSGQEEALQVKLGGKILLDKNPTYIAFIPFFLKMLPRMKLVVPLRDPRGVILSCYFQYFPMNKFSAQLLDIESIARRYVGDIGRWIEIRGKLDKSQYYEVRYEELVEAPDEVVSKLAEYMGLSGVELADRGSQARILNAPTYGDVRKGVYQSAAGRWQKYANEFDKVREILEPVMHQLGYRW
ncbi:tetratricopeptide repeat-containing sulfotransferase family protein [Rubritalea tangerina]|uniref:Tetratricopeptide repeat-containing sulfotransferase family protein n=2 Tax=Rubritalea tangerina TaxID=430798 RepID=A0ABW4ZCP5_9BACT